MKSAVFGLALMMFAFLCGPASAKDDKAAPRTPLTCRDGSALFAETSDRGIKRYGMKAPNGQTLVVPIYEALSCFHQGIAWVAIPDVGRWCPIGPDGRRRDKPACTVSYHIGMQPSHHAPEQLHEDPFTSSVLWVRKLLAYQLDPSLEPPYLIGDGVRGQGKMIPVWW